MQLHQICSSATTTLLKEYFTAGHILTKSSKGPAVLTKVLKVKSHSIAKAYYILFCGLLGSLSCCVLSSFSGTPKIVKPERPIDNEVCTSQKSCARLLIYAL